jgi:formylglycine-generating enzyme required for sulfatase activity
MKNNLSNPTRSMQRSIFALASFVCLLFSSVVYANNISVTNATLTGQVAVSGYTMVQFDISWENSFRMSSGTADWDAAWVFVKYKVSSNYGGDGLWKQAWLSNTGYTAPAGSAIEFGLKDPTASFNASSNPGMGAFVHRDADGIGTFTKTGVQLRWNYSQNYKTGTTPIGDNDVIDIQVFAIEMVYVPQGSFYLGTGGTETNAFYTYPTTTNPYYVTSEDAIVQGTAVGNLYSPYTTTYNNGFSWPTIPAAFPKGWKAFYCMKYEISQQGYVDFLNTLTRTQQAARVGTSVSAGVITVTNRYVMSNTTTPSQRNGIKCAATISSTDSITFYCDLNNNNVKNEAADGQNIACNYINNFDFLAYLDWSGLRPMTELEYEKACRGTLTPVANEYAWGSTTILNSSGVTNSGLNNEVSSTAGANCNYAGTVGGQMRVGSFAQAATTREQAGASYWGIMDLSGNAMERVVPVSWGGFVTYTGTHGDGLVDASGNPNTSTWLYTPTPSYYMISYRGGNCQDVANYSRVSDRYYDCVFSYDIGRSYWVGGRGVRIVP